jgi:transposase
MDRGFESAPGKNRTCARGLGNRCWRRLREWQQAGVWQRLHELLLTRLRTAGEIEWSWAIADFIHVQAKRGRCDRPELSRSG